MRRLGACRGAGDQTGPQHRDLGAYEGSIIAAIMTTYSPRKGSSARPMVLGSLPMVRASRTVTAHADAASVATAEPWHGKLFAAAGPASAA